jgi:serine/threonine protein kinase/formylglycine-generating enzyme required for sulfatase activity
MIHYQCSRCGQKIRARDEWVGRVAKCPRCGQASVVAREAATPAPAAAPAPKAAPPAPDPEEMESVLFNPAALGSGPGSNTALDRPGESREDTAAPKTPSAPPLPPTLEGAARLSVIRYRCPACLQKLFAPAGTSGKKGKCARCGVFSEIPAASGTAAPAAPPPSGQLTEHEPDEMESVLYNPAPGGRPSGPSGPPSGDARKAALRAADYQILGELGRGGMGVVYRAREVGLGRVVALKMILAGAHAGAEMKARLRREAEAVARLQHPNIVQLFRVGELDGHPFVALEFIDGGSLDKKVEKKPLPPLQAAQIVETLARTMHHAHQCGVIHRDLKPSNVLLARSARPEAVRIGNARDDPERYELKITDFGLAKQVEDTSGATVSGAILGTPSYMAPEQASGKSNSVGPAADIHALGAILYELLTGRPPFLAATSMMTLAQLLVQDPVPPRRWQPQLPPDLETICLKCLEKDPARRYPSAAALADDLRRYQSGEPIVARPVSLWQRGLKWARRRPAAAALVLVLLLSAASLVSVGLWYNARLSKTLTQERQARRAQALAEVDALLRAQSSEVPAILRRLPDTYDDVLPRLRELWERPDLPERQRLRVGLALLPVDEAPVARLYEGMLQAEPHEMLLIRDALLPHREKLAPQLWQIADDPATAPQRRFRALVVLAAFDPDDARWPKAAGSLVEPWQAENVMYLGLWTEALRPVRLHLLGPLGLAFRDRDNAERRKWATTILVDYAADQPKELVDLLLDADVQQYALLWPGVEAHRDRALAPLNAVLDREGRPQKEEAWEALARRQAQAAVTLYRLGQPERLWPRLQFRPDPRVRTYLIQRLGLLGVDPRPLVQRLEKEEDVSARRALILALGEFGPEQLPEGVRRPLVERLLDSYRTDPDPGLHAAIGWLLGHAKEGPEKRKLDWGQAEALRRIDQELKGKPAGGRRWFVDGQGQTLVLVPGPVEFQMGSPEDERGRKKDEGPQHLCRIPRSFAVADRKVTWRQFDEFLKGNRGLKWKPRDEAFKADPDAPVLSVDWYVCAQYCRWLSEREKLPETEMCYPPIADIEKARNDGTPLKLPANYLKRTGYRLPTEAEWEYACRAGSVSARFFGAADDDLALPYAWCKANSRERPWPVGQKRPNDLGLFDVYGNALERCQQVHGPYPSSSDGKPIDDVEDGTPITPALKVVMRGGGPFRTPPGALRSAARRTDTAIDDEPSFSLRVVRTVR